MSSGRQASCKGLYREGQPQTRDMGLNELSGILETVDTGLWELDTVRSFCALSVTSGAYEPIPLHCGVIF